jgi:alkanesulfonate monooxygenase SsuD/methylene tetrahydromethanopterin reductase-like flavin-dependent oxidoreductase (luciferase family)
VHVGVDSFVAAVTDPSTERLVGPEERMAHLLEEIALADEVGLYSFGIGEHHRPEYYDSAPPVILGAAAARTSRIRLGSAVTVLSAADPVRVFQQFATLDLISRGRVDLVVGRGSFIEAFPLFGLDLADYDSLFEEKLDLLLRLRESEQVTWSGRHRPALRGQGVYPRPCRTRCRSGSASADAGVLRPRRAARPAAHGRDHRRRAAQFAPLVDLYRRAGAQAGPRPRAAAGGAARLRLRRREHAGRADTI